VSAIIACFVAKEIFLSTVVVATGNPNPVEAIAHLSLGTPDNDDSNGVHSTIHTMPSNSSRYKIRVT